MGMLSYFDPTHLLDFSTGFQLGNRGNLESGPPINCSYICEIDVKLLNHSNWTSTAQVMVNFSGLPQLRLFISLCPDFRTGFWC